jgi:hypothetical protein
MQTGLTCSNNTDEDDAYLDDELVDCARTDHDQEFMAAGQTEKSDSREDEGDDPLTNSDGNPERLLEGTEASEVPETAPENICQNESSTPAQPDDHGQEESAPEPIRFRSDKARRPPAWIQDYELT